MVPHGRVPYACHPRVPRYDLHALPDRRKSRRITLLTAIDGAAVPKGAASTLMAYSRLSSSARLGNDSLPLSGALYTM